MKTNNGLTGYCARWGGDFTLSTAQGCGHIFEAGFVAYSNAAKSRFLGVDPGLIDRHGAVSREVVLAMAQGAHERSGADIALATTGFTGQAGADGEAGLGLFVKWRTRVLIVHAGRPWQRGSSIGCGRVAGGKRFVGCLIDLVPTRAWGIAHGVRAGRAGVAEVVRLIFT